jgi:hypothetical protein
MRIIDSFTRKSRFLAPPHPGLPGGNHYEFAVFDGYDRRARWRLSLRLMKHYGIKQSLMLLMPAFVY